MVCAMCSVITSCSVVEAVWCGVRCERPVSSVSHPVRFPQNMTALHRASIAGDCDMAKLLIFTGANVEAAAKWHWGDGVRALHLAAEHGRADLVRCLCQYGAQVSDAAGVVGVACAM